MFGAPGRRAEGKKQMVSRERSMLGSRGKNLHEAGRLHSGCMPYLLLLGDGDFFTGDGDFFTVDPGSCAQKRTWSSRCLSLQWASLHLQFAMSITSVFLISWLVAMQPNTVESWNDVWEWGALRPMQNIASCSTMKTCAGLRKREVTVKGTVVPSRHVELRLKQHLFWRRTVRSTSSFPPRPIGTGETADPPQYVLGF